MDKKCYKVIYHQAKDVYLFKFLHKGLYWDCEVHCVIGALSVFPNISLCVL